MKLPYPNNVADNSTRNYLINLVKALSGQDTRSAVGSILLASPNGSVYSVVVADDGTLSTVLEKGVA